MVFTVGSCFSRFRQRTLYYVTNLLNVVFLSSLCTCVLCGFAGILWSHLRQPTGSFEVLCLCIYRSITLYFLTKAVWRVENFGTGGPVLVDSEGNSFNLEMKCVRSAIGDVDLGEFPRKVFIGTDEFDYFPSMTQDWKKRLW